MKKPLILFLYATAMYFVLSTWYKRGNTGIPDPRVIAAPTYLYSILDLVSGFTGNLTVPLAMGMTFILVVQAKNGVTTTAVSPPYTGSGNRTGTGAAAGGATPSTRGKGVIPGLVGPPVAPGTKFP